MPNLKVRLRQTVTDIISNTRLIAGQRRPALLRLTGHKSIGKTYINPMCTFAGFGTRIGDGSFVNYGSYFDDSAPVTIGKNVGIGPLCTFLTGSHHLGPADHRISGGGKHQPITVEDGCWIGGRVTVLPGVTIGRGCVIAAGAVVTKDCAPNGLYAGVPARRIKDLQED